MSRQIKNRADDVTYLDRRTHRVPEQLIRKYDDELRSEVNERRARLLEAYRSVWVDRDTSDYYASIK